MGFAHALSPKTDASPTLFAAALSTFVVGAYSPDDSEKPATGTNVDIVALLKRIVDDGPIPTLQLTPDLTIRYMNRVAAQRLQGLELTEGNVAQQLLGKPIDLIQPDLADHLPLLDEVENLN